MELNTIELYALGFMVNNIKYRENGIVEEQTDPEGNVVSANIIKAPDKVTEYVLPFKTGSGESRYLALVVDTKDGIKFQVKRDLLIISPTLETLPTIDLAGLREKVLEYTGITL